MTREELMRLPMESLNRLYERETGLRPLPGLAAEPRKIKVEEILKKGSK